jgi:hypothetical protein
MCEKDTKNTKDTITLEYDMFYDTWSTLAMQADCSLRDVYGIRNELKALADHLMKECGASEDVLKPYFEQIYSRLDMSEKLIYTSLNVCEGVAKKTDILDENGESIIYDFENEDDIQVVYVSCNGVEFRKFGEAYEGQYDELESDKSK